MNVETMNETIGVCQYLGEEKITKMIEGEMALPDIKPDILSVVKVSGKSYIETIKPENDKITISGGIYVNIIYIADDDTNSHRGVNEVINFSETIQMKGVTPATIIRFQYMMGKIEYRIQNGRKIGIKVPILFQIKAFTNEEIQMVSGIADDTTLEVQKRNCDVCHQLLKGSTQIEVKENIQLDVENAPIGEILESDIQLTHQEYKLSYNKVLAKADAQIKIVYVADTENQEVDTFDVTLPLMGMIDMEAIDDTKKIAIEYYLKKFSVRPVYQEMQANSIAVEIVTEVNAYVCEQNDMELTTDVYMPEANLSYETESHTILKNVIDEEEIVELSQTLVVPELDHTKILNMTGSVTVNEKNVLNDKIAVTGNVELYVLYAKAGNQLIESKKLELPFQQVMKVEGITSSMDPFFQVTVEDISYMQAGENQLQVVAHLKMKTLADEAETMNSICHLAMSDEKVPHMPSMVIYYVKPGDTLWKIAKQYRNKVENIKEFNELENDTIYPGQRLLIPQLFVPYQKKMM